MEFIKGIFTWLETTAMYKQVNDVDIVGLFTNPWFIVPFVAFIIYNIWKQSWIPLVIAALFVGLWYITGTEYMQSLIDERGEINQNKILPVVGLGAGVIVVLGLIIFGRSD